MSHWTPPPLLHVWTFQIFFLVLLSHQAMAIPQVCLEEFQYSDGVVPSYVWYYIASGETCLPRIIWGEVVSGMAFDSMQACLEYCSDPPSPVTSVVPTSSLLPPSPPPPLTPSKESSGLVNYTSVLLSASAFAHFTSDFAATATPLAPSTITSSAIIMATPTHTTSSTSTTRLSVELSPETTPPPSPLPTVAGSESTGTMDRRTDVIATPTSERVSSTRVSHKPTTTPTDGLTATPIPGTQAPVATPSGDPSPAERSSLTIYDYVSIAIGLLAFLLVLFMAAIFILLWKRHRKLLCLRMSVVKNGASKTYPPASVGHSKGFYFTAAQVV